jgi:hypothetical protein
MAVSIVGTKFRAWSSVDGSPLAFGKVYTYQSGTNTPKVTYTTEGQETANANPVILNAAGYADIYLDGSYKIVVTDANDVEVHTTDPVTDNGRQASGWVLQKSATYVDPNEFTVNGNETAIFAVDRGVRVYQNGGYIYGSVVSAVYSAGVTTVTIDSDDILDISMEYVDVALVQLNQFGVQPITKRTLGNVGIYAFADRDDLKSGATLGGQDVSTDIISLINNDVVVNAVINSDVVGNTGGEGRFILTSRTNARLIKKDSSWVPNGDESHYLFGGTTYVAIQIFETNSKYLDVFVIYGQSNANGSASNTPGRETIVDAARYWSRSAQSLEPLNYTIESATTLAINSTGHAWGAFANRYYELTGRKMVFVPGACGGKSIAELSKTTGDGIYEACLTEYDKAISAITLEGHEIGNQYVLFHQGETDQSDGTTWDDYFDALVALIDDFQSDFDIDGFCLATVGNPTSRNEADWHRIRTAQEYACDRDSGASVVFDGWKYFNETNGLLRSDGTHATQYGYNVMGAAMAEGVARLQKNGSVTGGDKDHFHAYMADTVSTNRVKHISGVIQLTDEGATLYTRENNSVFISSNITGVSLTSTELIIECQGLRNHACYGISVQAYDQIDQTEIIHAHARATSVGNNKLAIAVRLNKNFTFGILTDETNRGIYKTVRDTSSEVDIYDTDSLDIDDSGTHISITHNTNQNPPVISQSVDSGTTPDATEFAVRYARVNNGEFLVPKNVGWLSCFLPSFTIRPNSLKAGTNLIIHVNAWSCSKAP